MDFAYRRSYRGPVRMAVLDWAGTAVDFGSTAPTAVFLRLFESRGVPITAEDARAGMGLMKKDHLRAILARPAVAAAWEAAHGAPVTAAQVEALFADFVPLQAGVLGEYAEPIPGLQDALADLRARGVRVGSTTGYTRAMMDVLAPLAAARGYAPDCIVCPDEVPAGRPYPWMCFQNAIQLGAYPLAACVKVGDTLPDVEEGLNAGMWTVGLSVTGNLVGLDRPAWEALAPEEALRARSAAEAQLARAGAHLVIEGIWDLPAALDEIEARLARGEQP